MFIKREFFLVWEVKGVVRLWFKETGGMVNSLEIGYSCLYGCTGVGRWFFLDRRRVDFWVVDGVVNFRLWFFKFNIGCLLL